MGGLATVWPFRVERVPHNRRRNAFPPGSRITRFQASPPWASPTYVKLLRYNFYFNHLIIATYRELFWNPLVNDRNRLVAMMATGKDRLHRPLPQQYNDLAANKYQ